MKKFHQMSQKKSLRNVQVNKLLSLNIVSKLDSIKLLYLFITVLLSGAIISGSLTTDARWMNWHFSRLGEGGMTSAIFFNITVFISALVMFMIALSLSNIVSHIPKNKDVDIGRANIIIYRSFTAVTVCLIGVAIFPFDRFPVVHNICGYSMLMIFMYLCISAPKFLPIFSKSFYLYSKLVILCVIICYTLFIVFNVISLLTVEFIIFTFLYAWLLLFVKGIRQYSYSYNNQKNTLLNE